jgi:hypothetical protein
LINIFFDSALQSKDVTVLETYPKEEKQEIFRFFPGCTTCPDIKITQDVQQHAERFPDLS